MSTLNSLRTVPVGTNRNRRTATRRSCIQQHQMVATLLLSLLAIGVGPAFATPNNGQGPLPPIGNGPIGPIDPDVPCDPPQLPPGILMPSYVRGQLRETCGGVLRPVANKPIEVILRVRPLPTPCQPPNIPPAPAYDVPAVLGATDANGAFEFEFYPEDFDVYPDNPYVEVKVQIVVYDDTQTVRIWETAYYGENPDHEYSVYEDVIYCLTEGTRIRVVSPSGDGAFNAEVFVNGELYPVRTNANGFVVINPPLPAGANLVARALVHESASERAAHNQGSTQNWKYHAYITSMPLQYDSNGNNAGFSPVEVTDPNGAYQLVLRRDSAYIGLHLVASIEWDASPTELNMFNSTMVQASDYVFNATDGQMLIERVDVFDDKVNWNEADFRVYADLSLRAHVDSPGAGFWLPHDLPFGLASWMHMSRSNDAPVYIHEFGHYGLLLKDEYSDDDDTHCAHGVGGSSPEFASNGGKASCMMFNQWNFTKICTAHAANPHLGGTRQGDEDCWSEIQRHFTAEAPGPNGAPRWFIKTPVDRGVIVGALCCVPLTGWDPVVELHDANNANLCRPVQFQWTSHNGHAEGARVFSKNAGGRTVMQGTTDANGIIKPFQGPAKTVAGLHVGDKIGATWYQFVGTTYRQFSKTKTFTDADCMSAMVILNLLPGQAPPAPQEQLVEGAILPFSLALQIEPGAAAGEATVRVRAGAELAAAPTVRLSVDNESTARTVSVALDAASGDWVGSVTGLPDQCAIVADVEATDADGSKSTYVTSATLTQVAHDEDGRVVAADGTVGLEIPAGALNADTRVAIGGSLAELPHDFPGRIVSGPFAFAAGDATLGAAATLRFRLPFDTEESLREQIDPDFLIVLAYDEATGRWNELDASFHRGELAIETSVDQFGSFVLLERGLGLGENPQEPTAEPPGPTGSDVQDGQGLGGLDTGACGMGTALASPLMLAALGAQRRRRRRTA